MCWESILDQIAKIVFDSLVISQRHLSLAFAICFVLAVFVQCYVVIWCLWRFLPFSRNESEMRCEQCAIEEVKDHQD